MSTDQKPGLPRGFWRGAAIGAPIGLAMWALIVVALAWLL